MILFYRPKLNITLFLFFFGGWNSGLTLNSSFTTYITQGRSNLSGFSIGWIDSAKNIKSKLIVPNEDSIRLNENPNYAIAPNRIAEINQILDEATAMLNRPYRAGGKTPAGFDCSGFVSYCYLNGNGQKLPVSSRDYFDKGTPVSLENALPGDVILFSGRKISKSQVGHVGIITEVSDDVYFIHSASSHGIRYDRISSAYYQMRFIGVRRF
jgi:cell wall-associated NlpC family hydrolase